MGPWVAEHLAVAIFVELRLRGRGQGASGGSDSEGWGLVSGRQCGGVLTRSQVPTEAGVGLVGCLVLSLRVFVCPLPTPPMGVGASM